MKTCRECGYPMYKRGAIRPRGAVVHCARGLCESCYSAAHDAGTLQSHPRTRYPSASTLDGWESLRALGCTRKDAARVLGLSYAALSRAIARG